MTSSKPSHPDRVTASSIPDVATIRQRSQKPIRTAACLIIGDEVLGGKTVDTNSAFMAKWCFRLGITLKRIEVISDSSNEIVEAARRMSSAYDFIITSGGIGPTHDDITYSSLSLAFSSPLTLHADAFARMKALSKSHPSQPNFSWERPSAALTAKLRMVELPTHPSLADDEQVCFPCADLWVPIVCCAGNVFVLPGVPRLFERLLLGLESDLRERGKLLSAEAQGEGEGALVRVTIKTPLAESEVAAYLTELAARVEMKGVKVGSYPKWGGRGSVTLVGRDRDFLESLVDEVVERVRGERVSGSERESSESGTE